MPASELVNRRWISRAASGPVTSYLQVEKRSQMPVPVRIASYSAIGSPPWSMVQGNPSSHIDVGPVGDVPVVQRRSSVLGHR